MNHSDNDYPSDLPPTIDNEGRIFEVWVHIHRGTYRQVNESHHQLEIESGSGNLWRIDFKTARHGEIVFQELENCFEKIPGPIEESDLHIEQLDRGAYHLGFCRSDGGWLAFNLHTRRRGYIKVKAILLVRVEGDSSGEKVYDKRTF